VKLGLLHFQVLAGACVALLTACAAITGHDATSADALPSWNNGAAKTAILEFVAAVTQENGEDYVPPPEHIAVFDDDGTLWIERQG
jgi:hypothetical protein